MRGSELQILRNHDFHRLIRVLNSESLKIINRMVLVTDYLSIINLNHFILSINSKNENHDKRILNNFLLFLFNFAAKQVTNPKSVNLSVSPKPNIECIRRMRDLCKVRRFVEYYPHS